MARPPARASDAFVGGGSKLATSLPHSTTTDLHTLRLRRRRRNADRRLNPLQRPHLTAVARQVILRKTDGNCHICGGALEERWQADHVSAPSSGGLHSPDNYLAAHALCNNYRWDYLPEEFQWILKIGVWTRTQIEHGTSFGEDVAKRFLAYEAALIKRRHP